MNIPKSLLLIFSCLLCGSMVALGNDDKFFLKDGYKYKIIGDGEVEVFWNNFPDSVPVCHDTLRIPSTVSIEDKEYRISTIGRQAFAGQIGIHHLVIDEGIEQIADEAFIGCLNLESVVLPNSIEYYGWDMFAYCPRLGSIKAVSPDGTPSPYDGCNALIDADDGILWFGCKGTVIPQGIEEIGQCAFQNCTGLEELTIPEGVRKIGNDSFWGCKNLKSIHLPSTLEEIGEYAFYNCESLTSVEIPANVHEISGNPFAGCINLRSLTVSPDNPYFDSRDNCNGIVRSSDSMLIAACVTTTIPEGIMETGDFCFYGPGIRELHFPSTIRNISAYAFCLAERISSITVAPGNARYHSPKCSNTVLTIEGDTLVLGCGTTVIPPSVTVIGDYAFCRRINRTVLTLPEGVVDIGDDAFSENNRLSYVRLPASAKHLGHGTFANCKNLCIGDLPSGLESIGQECFSGCTNLQVVNWSHKLRFIGKDAFKNCPCEKYVREKFADICR